MMVLFLFLTMTCTAMEKALVLKEPSIKRKPDGLPRISLPDSLAQARTLKDPEFDDKRKKTLLWRYNKSSNQSSSLLSSWARTRDTLQEYAQILTEKKGKFFVGAHYSERQDIFGCIKENDERAVHSLVNCNPSLIHATKPIDNIGHSPLSYALICGKVNLVAFFLERGANPNLKIKVDIQHKLIGSLGHLLYLNNNPNYPLKELFLLLKKYKAHFSDYIMKELGTGVLEKFYKGPWQVGENILTHLQKRYRSSADPTLLEMIKDLYNYRYTTLCAQLISFSREENNSYKPDDTIGISQNFFTLIQESFKEVIDYEHESKDTYARIWENSIRACVCTYLDRKHMDEVAQRVTTFLRNKVNYFDELIFIPEHIYKCNRYGYPISTDHLNHVGGLLGEIENIKNIYNAKRNFEECTEAFLKRIVATFASQSEHIDQNDGGCMRYDLTPLPWLIEGEKIMPHIKKLYEQGYVGYQNNSLRILKGSLKGERLPASVRRIVKEMMKYDPSLNVQSDKESVGILGAIKKFFERDIV